MTNRILQESRDEAQELFDLGIITRADYDGMMLLTARDVNIPEPDKFTSSRISKIRSKLRCSQKVFADIVGVTSDTISKWERGEREPEKPICRFLVVLEREGLSSIGLA
jgi:putative transcriptional regulator